MNNIKIPSVMHRQLTQSESYILVDPQGLLSNLGWRSSPPSHVQASTRAIGEKPQLHDI